MRLIRILGALALLLTAAIWGIAFVAQKAGMDSMEPSAFNAVRSFIGAAALIPVIMLIDRSRMQRLSFFGVASASRVKKKNLLLGGLLCGIVLTVASLLQQYGIQSESTGKSGFLTALYIVIVPVIGFFFRRRTTWLLWIAVTAALGGTYLLCMKPGEHFRLSLGDIWLIACALVFSLHILVIDRFAPKVDCVRLAFIQFFLTGVFSLVAALILGEPVTWGNVSAAIVALLFCGVGSSGVAYTLQMVGQKYVHPVAATLIMSLESVFALLGGCLLLHERLDARAYWGCAIIFTAVILAQIPVGKKHK